MEQEVLFVEEIVVPKIDAKGSHQTIARNLHLRRRIDSNDPLDRNQLISSHERKSKSSRSAGVATNGRYRSVPNGKYAGDRGILPIRRQS